MKNRIKKLIEKYRAEIKNFYDGSEYFWLSEEDKERIAVLEEVISDLSYELDMA